MGPHSVSIGFSAGVKALVPPLTCGRAAVSISQQGHDIPGGFWLILLSHKQDLSLVYFL